MKLFLEFTLVYLVLVTGSFADFEERKNCLRQIFDEILSDYSHGAITFTKEGSLRKYWVERRDRHTVVENLTLTISSNDNLKGISRVLAQGGDHHKILEKLQLAANTTGSLELSEIAPQVVKRLTNKKNSLCNKANCLNAVLNWHDPMNGTHFTGAEEFYKTLESGFIDLPPGAEVKFGDILVFENGDGDLVHAAIYLDDSLVWHKTGMSNKAPYIFETIEGAVDSYLEGASDSIRFFRKSQNPF